MSSSSSSSSSSRVEDARALLNAFNTANDPDDKITHIAQLNESLKESGAAQDILQALWGDIKAIPLALQPVKVKKSLVDLMLTIIRADASYAPAMANDVVLIALPAKSEKENHQVVKKLLILATTTTKKCLDQL
eukprot:TRINITY_DN5770_c1_g1_i1.p1 TRINITY_DN5770_c1_g1~~TRINITY_DN5770_c1_g1_i1.p1  ORF type:complete len:134 (+),score=56.58 TRINITY_DN5770_c1_g1_i1:81-482(+)